MDHFKDEHLALIAHELRAPLAALRMWVEVLRSGRPEDRTRAVDAIDRCARAEARLIEDLLDLAQLGKLHVREDLVDPRHALAEALEGARPEAEAKGLTLAAAMERDAGLLRGDAVRLRQVAQSLLSNAVKFTPEGGSVEVSLRGGEADLVIRVEDTGVGLDADALASLFTPFPPAGRAGIDPSRGLGIGLALARRLVELHGGTIQGENRPGGPGARFTVTLPRAATDSCDPA